MAMSNTANYVSAAVTPVLGGLVAQEIGWSASLAMAGVAAAAALLALRGLTEPARAQFTAS
jgi:predicted MFS family arabinose efflux permease